MKNKIHVHTYIYVQKKDKKGKKGRVIPEAKKIRISFHVRCKTYTMINMVHEREGE